MESIQLSKDGSLPSKYSTKYGSELSPIERSKIGAYGIGFFFNNEGSNDVFDQWFSSNNNTIRPHLDQLKKGLLFRLRGTKKMDALAIQLDEINSIILTKEPDILDPIKYYPFWLLLKIGMHPQYAFWFGRGLPQEYIPGDVSVTFNLNDQSKLYLKWKGEKWKQVRKFFSNSIIVRSVAIENQSK